MIKFKIIIIVLIITIEAVFAGLNMNNVSDISFGFTTLKDVPVFLSILISFVAGALIILPFTLISKKKKNNTDDKKPVIRKKISFKKDKKKDIEDSPL